MDFYKQLCVFTQSNVKDHYFTVLSINVKKKTVFEDKYRLFYGFLVYDLVIHQCIKNSVCKAVFIH